MGQPFPKPGKCDHHVQKDIKRHENVFADVADLQSYSSEAETNQSFPLYLKAMW